MSKNQQKTRSCLSEIVNLHGENLKLMFTTQLSRCGEIVRSLFKRKRGKIFYLLRGWTIWILTSCKNNPRRGQEDDWKIKKTRSRYIHHWTQNKTKMCQTYFKSIVRVWLYHTQIWNNFGNSIPCRSPFDTFACDNNCRSSVSGSRFNQKEKLNFPKHE